MAEQYTTSARELSVDAKVVGEEMADSDLDDLVKSIALEGVYETIVEGGFHQRAVSHETADELTEFITLNGVEGLRDLRETRSESRVNRSSL